MRVVIIGGNPAGLSAASRIRKAHKDWDLVVYEKGNYISYAACGIPYYIEEKVKDLQNLITLTKEDMESKRNVPIKMHHEVIEVNFEEKQLLIKNLDTGEEFEDVYDKLMIATGGKSAVPRSLNVDHQRVLQVHTLDDGLKVRKMLQKEKFNSVLIVGTGFIALEMLEVYKHYGISKITVVGDFFVFRTKTEERIKAELEKHGIEIELRVLVDRLDLLDNGQIQATLDNGRQITAELVQVSVGVIPATELFQEKGLKMAENGAILIDRKAETNIPEVYAAGDCTMVYHKLRQQDVYIPLAPAANKLGRIAGNNIAGKEVKPFGGVTGTFIFKVFDLYCSKTGLTLEEAKKQNYNAESIFITNNEIAHYYPGAAKMSVLLVFDKTTHRVLGAELTAPTPLGAKKIDVIVAAIYGEMTIPDLQEFDMAYAPPFAPVWDPILIAANIAWKKCEK